MGLLDSTAGRVAAGWSTGGLSEAYRALKPKGSGESGYAPLPFENPDNPVDGNQLYSALAQGLGRDPTPSEISQYSKYIKSGDLSYEDVHNITAGLPEQEKARLEQYSKQYGDALNQQNQGILDQAAATANSRFAGLGRPVTSAQSASVLQAGGQLAQARQSALADFYGRGLSNNLNQYTQLGQNTLNRGNALGDERTAYNRSLLGYQTQRNDYSTDLSNTNAQNRRRALGTLTGSILGAGAGALSGGGVKGAQLGAGIGGQAGGLFY